LLLFLLSVGLGGYDWTIESMHGLVTLSDESLRESPERSSLARWWRCRGVDRPRLEDTASPWTIDYSWTGGYGRGDVFLTLENTGAARLALHEHGDASPLVFEIIVPGETVMEIARTIDHSGLLCLTLLGYPVFLSNKIADNRGTGTNESTAYFGDFSRLYVGDRLGLSMMVDPFTKMAEAQVRLRVLERVGIVVAIPSAFCKVTGIQVS
jgi:hypothetical protein